LRNPAFNLDAQIQAQKDEVESSKKELSTLRYEKDFIPDREVSNGFLLLRTVSRAG